MSKHKRIFLVGHMGAGKGVVGKALADKLGWQFIDADIGLEHKIGRPLADILGKQGVESLHQCEAQILSHYIGKENVVVTTDSAIICTPKNRQLLSSEFVVYVKVSSPVQIERMANKDYQLLPVVDQKSFLEKLHEERDSLFEEVSKFTIDTDKSKSVDDVAHDISEILKDFEKT